MKKVSFLLLAFSAAFGVLSAQPTLQNNVFPEIGDVIISSTAQTTTLTEGNAGVNQSWNFTSLEADPSVSSDMISFVAVGGTPYAGQFPTATMAQAIGVDTPIYGYFKLESNQLIVLGSATQDFTFVYTDPQLGLKSPLAFNASFQDTYAGSFETEGIVFYTTGNHTTNYDAYGTLQTPSGTFNNAIRLKSVSVEKDSAVLAPGTYSLTESTTTSYDFYVPNRVGPQVSISYTQGTSTTVIPGFPPIVNEIPLTKSVSFVSSFVTAAPEPSAALGLAIESIGPNPATDQITVRFTQSEATRPLQLRVTDITGKLLQTLAVNGAQSITLPLAALSSGAYFLSLTDGQAVQTLRFVKN